MALLLTKPLKRQQNANSYRKLDKTYMSKDTIKNLKINELIDYRKENGLYVLAFVISNNKHHINIVTKNEKIKYSIDTNAIVDKLIAYPKYISERPGHRLTGNVFKKGVYVEVNPKHFDSSKKNGWHIGKIVQIKKGQIEIEYYYKNKGYKYWTHLDCEEELGHPLMNAINSIKYQIKEQNNFKVHNAVEMMQVFIYVFIYNKCQLNII